MDNTQKQKDERYMRMALEEAHKALEEDEIPIGAVVVCKDKVIAKAHNLTERLKDITAHAEMQAITCAANALGGKYLTDCTLYVTLEPCVMCAGALAWSKLSRIVYGATEEKQGYFKHAPKALHPKTVVEKGVLEEECATLLKTFFVNKRR